MANKIQTALGTYVLSTFSDVTALIIQTALGTHLLCTIFDVTPLVIQTVLCWAHMF